MEVRNNFHYQQSMFKADFNSQSYRDKIQEEAKNTDVNALTMQYTIQFQFGVSDFSQNNLFSQGASASKNPSALENVLSLIDYNKIGYTGKPIGSLSQNEAKALVAEDGFFGVDQTSQRLADFVLAGGGDDVSRLQQGREGIIRGYEQAEKLWGGELPEISKTTLNKALESIDKKIAELGGNVLNLQA